MVQTSQGTGRNEWISFMRKAAAEYKARKQNKSPTKKDIADRVDKAVQNELKKTRAVVKAAEQAMDAASKAADDYKEATTKAAKEAARAKLEEDKQRPKPGMTARTRAYESVRLQVKQEQEARRKRPIVV